MTGYRQDTIESNRNTQLLPFLVAGILCALSFLLWWGLARDERAKQRQTLTLHAKTLAADIEGDLRARIPSLERMVKRWVFHKGTEQEEFILDAAAYVADLPGFQALEWVDKGFVVRRVVPLWGNEQAVGLNLAFEENRRVALEKAKARRAPTMTRPIDLVQGGKGFLLYLPIYLESDFDGFILAVFETKSWLEYVFRVKDRKYPQDDYAIKVSVSGVPIFEQAGWNLSPGSGDEASAEVSFLDQTFTVACRPMASFNRGYSTPLPIIAAAAGLFMSLLVGYMVHLYQKAVHEAWKTRAAQRELEMEVNERKKAAGQMERLSTRLTLATRAGKIGVWEWDVKSGQLTWDERMFELYDVPPDVVPQYETWRNALHPDDAHAAETRLQDAVRGKALFDTQFRIVLSDGSIRHIHAAARANRDAAGNPVRMTGVNWDISDQKKAEETIRHLATHDALTGLPSLRLAKDRIDMALAGSRRSGKLTALLFIDLDGFKAVNDMLGHNAGDEALQETAQRLKSCVREMDTVARIGGDEFLVVLTEIGSREDAAHLAGKIVAVVSEPLSVEGASARIGASVGIAMCRGVCHDSDKLIQRADAAMYSIKKAGKNGYAFAEEVPGMRVI
jgi:diguanylate cyclase (GGDEF)-like protein